MLRVDQVKGGFSSVDFSPDGRYVAAASGNGFGIHVWEVATGTKVHSFSQRQFLQRSISSPRCNLRGRWHGSARAFIRCENWKSTTATKRAQELGVWGSLQPRRQINGDHFARWRVNRLGVRIRENFEASNRVLEIDLLRSVPTESCWLPVVITLALATAEFLFTRLEIQSKKLPAIVSIPDTSLGRISAPTVSTLFSMGMAER